MTMLVRLKPLSERKGHKLRVYMYKGARFTVERGWYAVDDSFAEHLSKLKQDHYDPDSADAFDVCTEEEAKRLEEKERRAEANERATVSQPERLKRPQPRDPRIQRNVAMADGDFTSADLRTQSEEQDEAQLNPPDDDEESDPDSGRVAEVGRVLDRPSSKPGPKIRTKR